MDHLLQWRGDLGEGDLADCNTDVKTMTTKYRWRYVVWVACLSWEIGVLIVQMDRSMYLDDFTLASLLAFPLEELRYAL